MPAMIIAASFLILAFTPSATANNDTASQGYQANLELLFAALQKNATSTPPFLYAKGSVGVVPDKIYGLALCRGDTDASSCSACIQNSFRVMLNYSTGAFYGSQCVVRFDSLNFLEHPKSSTGPDDLFAKGSQKNFTAPLIPGWDPGNAENLAFNTGIIRAMLLGTAELAANTTRRYGTRRMDVSSSFPAVYSLAQCTPEMTPTECWACLKNISDVATETFGGTLGAQLFALWCNMRYEAYKFYDGEPMQHFGMSVGAAPPPHQGLPPAAGVANHQKPNNSIRRMRKATTTVAVVVVPLLALFICIIVPYGYIKRVRKGKASSKDKNKMILKEDETLVWSPRGRMSEFMVYDLSQVSEATRNFSEENKLGQGGFGPVYKGCFHDGLEIAVKRLASHSGQGFTEFKNEIELIANLQHTNLVKLLGCCSQGDEKILIYEYLPNKSLDFFIFDETRRDVLDWAKRIAIIDGIAQGLLYLHKHSRLRVIHRDLKASNVLLDRDMNPKISDFGLAKIFSTNDSEGNTNRIVGTYGYMAPEYASEGLFSIKSDVFSFGVLILEIVSGQRTSKFHRYGDFINLLGHAWQLWKDGLCLQLVDASLVTERHALEMMRCINIALLCVQESADDRPTMSHVAAMLSSESMTLPEPKHPAYFHIRVTNEQASTTPVEPSSINGVTISALGGR